MNRTDRSALVSVDAILALAAKHGIDTQAILRDLGVV
jgi:hypothetical protein